MAKASQWNVKGVDEASRGLARDAAAAAHMPIGIWIDRAVKRAAAAQPRVVPPPIPTVSAQEPSLIERAMDTEPAELDLPSAEAPPVGPASEIPPDQVPRSAGGGIGRGARIGVALAIMAALTGGAVWLLSAQLRPPAAPATGPQTASMAPAAEPAAPQASAATPEMTALEALRQTAQTGEARSQYDLGVRYATGRDVPKDDTQAARWFERAAVQGMASAQYNLGVMYDRGLGLTEDPTLAFFWYQSAAEQGHARAQHNLATAFADGRGTNQDLAQAARWFELAAASGVPESQYYLGVMYERGMGVPQNTARATALYRSAANQGHKQAVERLTALRAAAPGGAPGATVSQVEDFTTGKRDAALPRATIAEIQRLLSRLDFDPGPADGVMGKKTVDAIAKYQAMADMPVDGKASASLLDELREVASAAKR